MIRKPIAALLVALVLAGGVAAPRTVHAASGTTLYVDGKTGSDSNDGRSTATAFKTIAKAALTIPAGSAPGWTVVVKGYTDYVYRERPIGMTFASWGSSTARITFQASGYVPGRTTAYVKPIVSGADVAPKAGQRWSASSTAGVYFTPWDVEPFWYGKQTGTIKTAIYQDLGTWLWEQTSLSALGSRAASGLGGFWWDRTNKRLYVSAVGNPATGGTNPTGHAIDVPVRTTFYFKGTQGVKYVDVRGFEVRHSGNGIGFDLGTDYSTAADNRLVGNFPMGLVSAGTMNGSTANPAIGNNFGRNEGWWNVLELIKIDEGNQSTTVCDNITRANGLRGIFVQGPGPGSKYTGVTKGVLVCRNQTYDHTFNPTGSIYNNAAGITIANGAQSVTLDSNKAWNNDVGIHIVQEGSGRAPITGLVLKKNVAYQNRRFGLNFQDGYYGNGGGTATSTSDVYWGNGTGVMVNYGSTNKSFAHLTLHANTVDGMRVGTANKTAASVKVTTSLFTNNGSYGIWLVTGSTASVTYSGFASNKLGSTKGSIAASVTNTKPAGYLSTTASNSSFLKIGTTSYQYTAGPSATPIGARY